jgi:hypothetical protein
MLLLLCRICCCLCMLLLLCRIQAIFHTCNSLTAIYPNRIRRQDSAVPNPYITYHLRSFFHFVWLYISPAVQRASLYQQWIRRSTNTYPLRRKYTLYRNFLLSLQIVFKVWKLLSLG